MEAEGGHWGRTALYRLFNTAGRLLYIGVAANPRIRFSQHAAEKPWWPEVASHTLEWLDSRPAALKSEAEAICDEDPAYNIRRHPYRPVEHPRLRGPVVAVQMQAARNQLRARIDAAANEQQHTVIERHGRPVAVLVPVAWYIGKGGDPREPLEQIAEEASGPHES